MTDLSNSPYATRLKKPTALRSSAIPKPSSPVKPKAAAAGPSPTRAAAASVSQLPHANTTGSLGPPVRGDEHPPPNTPSSPAVSSSSPVRPATRKSVGGSHRLHTPAAAASTPSYAKPTIANSSRLPATAGAAALKQPRSILKKPQPVSNARSNRPVAKPATPLTPRRAAAVAAAQAQAQPRSAQPHVRNASQSKLPVRKNLPTDKSPVPAEPVQGRPASASEEAVQAVLASALAAQQLASQLQQQDAAVSAHHEHRQSGSVVSRHSRQASQSVEQRLEGAELLDHDVLGDIDDIDDIDTAFDDDALQADDAPFTFAAADSGLETNSAPAASDDTEQQHNQPEDGDDFAAAAPLRVERGSLSSSASSKLVEEEKTQEDEISVAAVTTEDQQVEAVELRVEEEKEEKHQQAAELETSDDMEAASADQPTEPEAPQQPAPVVEYGSTAEFIGHSAAVEAAEEHSSSRSGHSRSDTAVHISSYIPDTEETTTTQEAAPAAAAEVTEAAHESLPVPTSNFATIIIDRDPALGDVGAEVTPVTRTPNVTVSEPVIALLPRPADDSDRQAEDEQDGRHKLDVVEDDEDELPTRTPAPSAALPPIATSPISADAAIEIISSPIASSLVSYDTAALEHQPTASVTNAAAGADSTEAAAAAPAVAAPAAAAAAPAAAAVGHTRVKSVAFSPDVTAFAAPRLSVGSVDYDLDDIDFGADNAPFPVTPQRNSLAHDVVTAISSAVPAPTPAPTVAASAASTWSLKEMETARRAEEDSRRREAELRAKEKAEDDKYEREKAELLSAQAAQQLDESRRQLFSHYLAGVQCLKLGKKGSPRQTRVYIRETEGHRWVVGWDSKKKTVESAQLLLADCRCVVGGEEGMFLHRKYMGKWAEDRGRCVSVLSTVRGLDVVLDSLQETNHWIAIMRQLGVKVVDKQRQE